MAGTVDIDPRGTDNFIKNQTRITRELRQLANSSVRTQADVDRIRRDGKELITQLTRELDEWNYELTQAYRVSFKDGADIPLQPSDSKRSMAIRKRLMRNGQSAVNDIDRWFNTRVDMRATLLAESRAKNFIKDAKRQIDGGMLSPSAKKKLLDQVRQANEALETTQRQQDLIRKRGAGDKPEVMYRRRRKKKLADGTVVTRGAIAARRDAEEYWTMLGNTGQRDIVNEAYLRGLTSKNIEWVLVSDGPDCGWRTHKDAQKANGMIVHIDDVVPLAHPYCRRGFAALPDGPKGKKTNNLLKQITGAADRRQLAKLATTAAVLGQALTVGAAFKNSPIVRTAIRAILEEKEIALGEFTQKILNGWANVYARNEMTALAVQGREVNSLTVNNLRDNVVTDLQKKLSLKGVYDGSDFTQIRLRREEALVLGWKDKYISRGELISRLEDYTDYVRHIRDREATALRAVSAAANDENVISALFGTQYVKNHMTRATRGSELFTNFRKMNEAIDKAFDEKLGPEVAKVELVKLAATVIEPIPWLRTSLGAGAGRLRFSVGMSAEGRRNLAKTLYLKMKGQEFRGRYNAVYSRNALGQVMKDPRITPRDVYNALIPRVTFLGKPINFSIMADNGRIVPFMHVYPDNAFMKHLSFRWRLRTNTINELLKEWRRVPEGKQKEWLALKLKELPDDMIWTIDLFRNGPVSASMRIAGDEVESYAIKLRPDNEVVRSVYRIRRGTRIPVGNKEELIRKAKHLGVPGADKSWTNEQLRAAIGREVSPNMRSMVLVPKAWGGLDVPMDQVEVRELVVGLARLKGSLMEATRTLGLDFIQTVRSLDRIYQTRYGRNIKWLIDDIRKKGPLENTTEIDLSTPGGIQKLRLVGKDPDPIGRGDWDDWMFESRLPNVTDFEDAIKRMRQEGTSKSPILDVAPNIHSSLFQLDLDGRNDPNLAAAWEDIISALNWLQDDRNGLLFRKIGVPRIAVAPADKFRGASVVAHYKLSPNTIEFNQDWIDNYGSLRSMFSTASKSGWSVKGVKPELWATVIHEYGHYVTLRVMRADSILKLWNRFVMDMPGIPQSEKASFLFSADDISNSGRLNDLNTFALKTMGDKSGVNAPREGWMQDPRIIRAIREELGEYASTNPAELLAEAFTQAILGDHRSHFATAMEELLRAEGLIR